MTRKELANELYDLYIKRGVLTENQGCGKEVWVKRVLNGCGASKRYSKETLIQCIKWAKEDLGI